jgi:hypothetical protein
LNHEEQLEETFDELLNSVKNESTGKYSLSAFMEYLLNNTDFEKLRKCVNRRLIVRQKEERYQRFFRHSNVNYLEKGFEDFSENYKK